MVHQSSAAAAVELKCGSGAAFCSRCQNRQQTVSKPQTQTELLLLYQLLRVAFDAAAAAVDDAGRKRRTKSQPQG